MSKGLDLLIPTKAKENASSSKATTNPQMAKKEGSSLFDKLLVDVKKDSGTKTTQANIANQNLSKGDLPTNKLVKNSESLKNGQVEIGSNNLSKKNLTSSLNNESIKDNTKETQSTLNKSSNNSSSFMDRLVQDSKKIVSEQNSSKISKVENSLNEKKINLANENSTKIDKNAEKIINQEDKKVITLVETTKEKEGTKNLSLMDRLVKEAETKTSKLELNKTNENTQNKEVTDLKINKEKVVSENKNLEATVTKEKDTSKIDNKIQTIITSAKETKLDEVIEKEVNVSKKEESLIDKIIKDNAKKEESISKFEKNKDAAIENKTTSNNSSLKELKEEIKEESKALNKEQTSKVNLEKTAETVTSIKTDLNEKAEIKKEIKEDVKALNKEETSKVNLEKAAETVTRIKTDLNEKAEIKKDVLEVRTLKDENKVESKISTKIDNTSLENEVNTIKNKINVTSNEEIEVSKKETLKSVNAKENSEIRTPLNNNSEVKNEKVASLLSKLNESSKNETINIKATKDELLNSKDQVTKKDNSLIDKILNDSKTQNKEEVTKLEIPTTKKTLEEMMKEGRTTTVSSTQSNQSKNDMVTNIYLSSQKKQMIDNSLEVKSEAVKIVKDANNTKDIEKGAKMLNLGLENQEVTIEEPKKKKVAEKVSISSTFDKLSLFRNNVRENLENKSTGKMTLENIVKNVTNEVILPKEEKIVELNVNIGLAQTIQNRIVSARQQMSSMMSDLARTMYENYKPPVTAFRINLNPSALGSIAIILRNEQRNSLSISMNISNSSTKEILLENQGSLRDSLTKTFENSTNFNLNFEESEENYFNANQEKDSNENFENEKLASSDNILNKEEVTNSDEIVDSSNYM